MLDECPLYENIAYLWEMVWNFRRQYRAQFTTPSPMFSLYFAETETGEARDAWIRSHSGDTFARATERNRNLQHELGQTLMMVLSAFDEEPPSGRSFRAPVSISHAAIAIASASAVMEATVDIDDCPDVWQMFAWEAIVILMYLIDAVGPATPVETMEDVLADIYMKRVQPKLNV